MRLARTGAAGHETPVVSDGDTWHDLTPLVDELDGRVAEFCQRVALNPLDVLTVHKHVTNRTAEIMGSRLAAFEGAEYDAIAHMTPSMAEFGRRVNTDGLRAALAWRDGPYTTGPAADHDAAARRQH